MARPIIIRGRCAAQPEICPPIKECPLGAVAYKADDEELSGGLIIIDLDKCDGCGICVNVCCGHCIEMTEEAV